MNKEHTNNYSIIWACHRIHIPPPTHIYTKIHKTQTTVLEGQPTTPQSHPTQPPTLQLAPTYPSMPAPTTAPPPASAPQIMSRILSEYSPHTTPSTSSTSSQSATALGGDSSQPLFTSIYWELEQFRPHLTGAGTVIAILDTGINTQHSAFPIGQKVLQYSKNFVQDELPDNIIDLNGHGTLCAGIAAGCSYFNAYHVDNLSQLINFPGGVAFEAQLIVCRVAKDSGPTSYSPDSIVQALDHLINIQESGQKVDVVSMSFGFPKLNKRIEDRIFKLKRLGTICVAAASNDGKRKAEAILYPASDGNVICIGAHDSLGNRADISPAGKDMEYLAPGINVLGPAPALTNHNRACFTSQHMQCKCGQFPHSLQCADIQLIPCTCTAANAQALWYDNGTSYAAPAVAGLISLLIQLARTSGENISNIQVIRQLLKEMSPTKQPSFDCGYGTLRPQEFLRRLIQNPGLLRSIKQEVA